MTKRARLPRLLSGSRPPRLSSACRRPGTQPRLVMVIQIPAGSSWPPMWIGPATAFPAMVGQQILLGGGIGLLVPPMTGLLLSGVERSRSGVASGALTAFRQAGSLLGVAIFGALTAGGHFYGGLHGALWISIAVLAASGVLIRLRGCDGRASS